MKIALTTSTFAQYSDDPLAILHEAGHEYVLNPYGRKLMRMRLNCCCGDVWG